MINLGLNLNGAALWIPPSGGASAPPPPPPPPPPSLPDINTVSIEGDSISADASAYHLAAQAAYPAVNWTNHAVGGAQIGNPADAAGTNSLWGRIDAVEAAAPDLLTIAIGANDMSRPDWLDALKAYTSEIRTRLPDVLIMAATPLPQSTSVNANFENYRSAITPTIYAEIGLAFDGVIPIGEHPVMGEQATAQNDTALYRDGLHPGAAGHKLLEQVYLSAVGSVIDKAQSTAPAPFSFIDTVNAGPGTAQTSEAVISGLGLGVSVSGTASGITGGNGDAKVGTGNFGANLLDIQNGSVITARATAAQANGASVGTQVSVNGVSDTFDLTTIPANPVGLAAMPMVAAAAAGTSILSVTTAGTGRLLLGIVRGTFGASSVVIKDAGSIVANCNLVESVTWNNSRALFVADTELPAGTYDVEVSGSGSGEVSLYPALLSNTSSPTPSGSGADAQFGYQNPSSLTLDNPVSVASGGLGILWAFAQNGYNSLGSNSLSHDYADGWSFMTFTSSGTADLNNKGGTCGMIGAAFA